MPSPHILRPDMGSRYRGGRLPIAPWRAWVLTGPVAYMTAIELARATGYDEAVIRRWRTGMEQWVSVDIVDKALCNLRRPGVLNDLYPCCLCHGVFMERCPNAGAQLDLELAA
jgi:hypothetical protein